MEKKKMIFAAVGVVVLLVIIIFAFSLSRAAPKPTPTPEITPYPSTIAIPTVTENATATPNATASPSATVMAKSFENDKVEFEKEIPKYSTASGGFIILPVIVSDPESQRTSTAEVRITANDFTARESVSNGIADFHFRIDSFEPGAVSSDIITVEFNPEVLPLTTDLTGTVLDTKGEDIDVKFIVRNWNGQPSAGRIVRLSDKDGHKLIENTTAALGEAHGSIKIKISSVVRAIPVAQARIVLGGIRSDTSGTNANGLIAFTNRIRITKDGDGEDAFARFASYDFAAANGYSYEIVFRVTILKGLNPVQEASVEFTRGSAIVDQYNTAKVSFSIVVKNGFSPVVGADVTFELLSGEGVASGKTDTNGELSFTLPIRLSELRRGV